MEIIQTELRLKDIDWVQKAVENMRKTTRSLGSTSLADKAKKEELVCPCLSYRRCSRLMICVEHRGEGPKMPFGG
jgi:ribosome-binding ATPase YchF (GTP1/OBG family)